MDESEKMQPLFRTTPKYSYRNDPWYYDSAGYTEFGKQFANEVFRLIINFEKKD